VVENSASTALESTADTTNTLNQRSPTIEINIGEQVNTEKAAPDDTDTVLTAAKMETGLNEYIVEPPANDRLSIKRSYPISHHTRLNNPRLFAGRRAFVK
jgi:hypothetical protein